MVSQPKTPPPDGNQDASGGLLATTILVTTLSIIIVGARFATRIWVVKRIGWDDWTILFACVRLCRHGTQQTCSVHLAWTSHWDRTCRNPDSLRTRQALLLSNATSISRSVEVWVGRVAPGTLHFLAVLAVRLTYACPDICGPYVHESVYMSFPIADHDHNTFHSTLTSGCRYPDLE